MSTELKESQKPQVQPDQIPSESPDDPAPEIDNKMETVKPDDDAPAHLERILSMKVPVIVKITEKSMTMERILKLNLGSMIQFDKDAYQHIDLMVNNSTIGLGQPIKIGENFGLKITQIKDIRETIKSLGGNLPTQAKSKDDPK